MTEYTANLELSRTSATARWNRTVRSAPVNRTAAVRGTWKQRLNLAVNSAPKITWWA